MTGLRFSYFSNSRYIKTFTSLYTGNPIILKSIARRQPLGSLNGNLVDKFLHKLSSSPIISFIKNTLEVNVSNSRTNTNSTDSASTADTCEIRIKPIVNSVHTENKNATSELTLSSKAVSCSTSNSSLITNTNIANNGTSTTTVITCDNVKIKANTPVKTFTNTDCNPKSDSISNTADDATTVLTQSTKTITFNKANSYYNYNNDLHRTKLKYKRKVTRNHSNNNKINNSNTTNSTTEIKNRINKAEELNNTTGSTEVNFISNTHAKGYRDHNYININTDANNKYINDSVIRSRDNKYNNNNSLTKSTIHSSSNANNTLHNSDTITTPHISTNSDNSNKNNIEIEHSDKSRSNFLNDKNESRNSLTSNELSKPKTGGSSSTSENYSFADLNVEDFLFERLTALEFSRPTPVQFHSLKDTLAGLSVVVQAETGSGKTLAYLLPIVQKIELGFTKFNPRKKPKAIILLPTRSLCFQVYGELHSLSPFIKVAILTGATDFNSQKLALKNGVDVVIGSLGRVSEHLKIGSLHLSKIDTFVIDEADLMVDAGTLNIIEDLLLRTSRNRQLMLFSATIPDHIKELANKYVTKGKFIDMKALTGTIAPKQLLHRVVLVSEKEMKLVISDLLRLKCPQRCIIFVKTKFEGYKLSSELLSFGHQSLILNADIPQNERERCLFLFRKGHLPLLIVTDLAARGVDIPACDMVIQTPSAVSSIENYIHRAGRAGRSGRNGINYQLLYANCEPHAKFFNDISKIALVARESKPVLKDIITESLFRAEKEMEKVDESSYTPAIALAKKILKGSSSRGEVEIAQLLSLCAKLNLLLK